ncbi:MAG TPA: hypothetical protein VK545_20440 [Streptomyces sp.]|nr:hypothetical protein [Streptomyces sp.]
MSLNVEVRIDRGRLQRVIRARGGPSEQWLRRLTERVANRAGYLAPGRMGRYVSHRVEEGPAGLAGIVKCDHPATTYVVNGTRPHIIRPRRRKALRFDIGGRTVFAAVVRHPGTQPNNFLWKALRDEL